MKMKELILKKIVLSNWQGQNREICFNEDTTIIKGKNGSGKTSIFKAFAWLLTSYTDALNNKNHELYDNRKDITEDTPEACVMAVISIDGIEYTIEKRARAKFSLNKTTGEWEKDSSDTYTILIDSIEISASNYNKWLEDNIAPSDFLLYMLIGERFANLAIDDKKKARKVLETISGDVKYSDLTGDYSLIAEDLKKFTIEQIKERYKNQIKPLKDRITAIENQVKVTTDEIASYQQVNFDKILEEINTKELRIKEIDELMCGNSSEIETINSKRNVILNSINDLTLGLTQKRANYIENQSKKLNELKFRLNEFDSINKGIERRNIEIQTEFENNCKILETETKTLARYKKEREELLSKLAEVKARVWNGGVCAYCGQELPSERQEELLNDFNAQKTSEINKIIKLGKELKDTIDQLELRVNNLQKTKDDGVHLMTLASKENLEREYEEELAKITPFEETNEYKEVVLKISELKKQMPELPVVDNKSLTDEKTIIISELRELNRAFGKKDVIIKLREDVENLLKERKDVGIEIARIMGCLANLTEYEEERANIISDRVNKKLHGCKIVMYSRQKDGDLKPDCVLVNLDNVKYSTINNSDRIKMCLSIQKLFCTHFNIKIPFFIDEASIFTAQNKPTFDNQAIYLYADDVEEMTII